jgi:hypothetical protein
MRAVIPLSLTIRLLCRAAPMLCPQQLERLLQLLQWFNALTRDYRRHVLLPHPLHVLSSRGCYSSQRRCCFYLCSYCLLLLCSALQGVDFKYCPFLAGTLRRSNGDSAGLLDIVQGGAAGRWRHG